MWEKKEWLGGRVAGRVGVRSIYVERGKSERLMERKKDNKDTKVDQRSMESGRALSN